MSFKATKVYAKNQGPNWLKGLDKYIEPVAPTNEARKKDAEATARNHGGERNLIDDATYVDRKGSK